MAGRRIELVPGEVIEAQVRRSAAPHAKRAPRSELARLRAENVALRKQVEQVEQAVRESERADADQRVAAVRAAWQRETETRRAKDRNRKKDVPAVRRSRGPRWTDGDEQHMQAVVTPYETECQTMAHRRDVDTDALTGRELYAACSAVAAATGRSYAAVRSILRAMAQKGAMYVRVPPSGDGRSSGT
ncbi:hypothetical protein KF840_23095 [bacterium]|nr:hypothetical protein [bacterium]